MSECGCILIDCNYRSNELSKNLVRSRKSHVCDECGETIPVGAQYERYAGLDSGDFFVHKTCSDCLSIRDSMFCDGWIWGHVLEDTQQHVFDMQGNISSDCLLDLTPVARQMIIGFIDELWSDWEEDDE